MIQQFWNLLFPALTKVRSLSKRDDPRAINYVSSCVDCVLFTIFVAFCYYYYYYYYYYYHEY